jgi:hypothetical protein
MNLGVNQKRPMIRHLKISERLTEKVCPDLGSRFGTFALSATIGVPSPAYSLLVRGLWFHLG